MENTYVEGETSLPMPLYHRNNNGSVVARLALTCLVLATVPSSSRASPGYALTFQTGTDIAAPASPFESGDGLPSGALTLQFWARVFGRRNHES